MRAFLRGQRQSSSQLTSLAGADASSEAVVDGSALLVEVGSTLTRTSLVDRVAGQHRLVAFGASRSTLNPPTVDLIPGVRAALSEIERATQRRVIDGNGIVSPERPDGVGVDALVLTSGQLLRVGILPLEGGLPVARIRSALSSSGVLVVEEVDLDGLARSGSTIRERLRDLFAARPDVILVLGRPVAEPDTRLGDVAMRLVRAVQHAPEPRPSVLFVGAPSLGQRLKGKLDDEVELRLIDASVPQDPRVAVGDELRSIWRAHLGRRCPGYDIAESWLSCPITPTSEAFATALRFLARRRSCRVWGIDVGSATSCLVQATADRSTIYLAEIGVAEEIGWALADEVFRRLLPGVEPDALRDALWNRRARPWAVPDTPEEESISRALTREAIGATRRATDCPACRWSGEIGLVVARGGGCRMANQPVECAWAIAEGLKALGVFELALDRHELLPGLGALAGMAPQAAAEALLSDGLTHLATMVLGEGRAHLGSTAGRAELRYQDGRVQHAEVLLGQVVALSLDAAAVGDLTLTPEREVDFGWGEGKPISLRVRGGTAGLLIGARPAPEAPVRGTSRAWRLGARTRHLRGTAREG